MLFPTDRTAHTIAFDGPVVHHSLEWKIAQTANASAMQDRSAMHDDQNLYIKVLYHFSYVPPRICQGVQCQFEQDVIGLLAGFYVLAKCRG